MEVPRDKVEIVTVNGTSIVSCTSDDDTKSLGSYKSETSNPVSPVNCGEEDFDQVGSLRPSRFSCFIRVSYCGATWFGNSFNMGRKVWSLGHNAFACSISQLCSLLPPITGKSEYLI